jgi:hypothetical protein
MSAYDFKAEYKPGGFHNVPDELSRVMTLGHSETPTIDVEETFIPCMVIESDADPRFFCPSVPETQSADSCPGTSGSDMPRRVVGKTGS